MKTIRINVEGKVDAIDIGRRGETGVTEVEFDISSWLDEFSTGTVALYVRRHGDTAAYPVALTTENGIAIWAVSNTDTNVKGFGRAELVLSANGVVKKSAVWSIYVGCDIGQPTRTPPDPYESWLERLGELGAETQENAEAAADSAEAAAGSASDAADSADAAEDSAEAAAASAEQAAAAAAHGIPAGGTRGQVLTKLSDEDFDADFEDPSGGIAVLECAAEWKYHYQNWVAITDSLRVITPPDVTGMDFDDLRRVRIYMTLTQYYKMSSSASTYTEGGTNKLMLYPKHNTKTESESNSYIGFATLAPGVGYSLSYWPQSSARWALGQTNVPQQVDDGLSASSTYPVQNKVIKAALDLKADLASPTFTGTPSAPTAADGTDSQQIASTAFVQREAAKKLPLAGGTMTGAIAMGSHKITGLANGTNDGDAVNLGQVSDMISTNTAFFRGSFASLAALQAVPWQTANPAAANYVTNNDYAVVLDDEDHDDECWRYVYVTGTGWSAQYRINEAPLTVAQLAALNSGATAAKIAQIETNRQAIANMPKAFIIEWNELTSSFENFDNIVAAYNAGKALVLHLTTGAGNNTALDDEFWLTDYVYLETETEIPGEPNDVAKAFYFDIPLGRSGGIPTEYSIIGIYNNSTLSVTDYEPLVYTGIIPKTALASAVQTSLGKADTAYQKPSGGIPKTDLASAVQTSLGKADTAYQKPSGGIPANDLAPGVIPSVPSASSSNPAALGTAAPGSSASYARGDHVHPMPSASNVGAIAAPANPSSGQFLVYNGSAWVAQSLSTWSGGSY